MKCLIVLSALVAVALAHVQLVTPGVYKYHAVPVASQFHSQDELGQYSYGYSGGSSAKTEYRGADGSVAGGYSYVDPVGKVQNVQYTADAVHGFRVAATNLPVAPVADVPAPVEAPTPVEYTPEVVKARADHLAKFEEVKNRKIEEVVTPVVAPIAYTAPVHAYPYNYVPHVAPAVKGYSYSAPAYYPYKSYAYPEVKSFAYDTKTAPEFKTFAYPEFKTYAYPEVKSFAYDTKIAPEVKTFAYPEFKTYAYPEVKSFAYDTKTAPEFKTFAYPEFKTYAYPEVKSFAYDTKIAPEYKTYAYAAPAVAYSAPISSQFHAQDELGQYSYGYSGGLSAKTEVKSFDGVTRGGYSYVDANNVVQNVQYTADDVHGFRVAATNLPSEVPAYTPVDTIVETPEVVAAKSAHFAAHVEAKERYAKAMEV